MRIDLSEQISNQNMDEYKTSLLIDNLNKVNSEMDNKFNAIIIPMNLYNIILNSEHFVRNYKDLEDGLIEVGSIDNFNFYLTLSGHSDEIFLTWDKQNYRDVKINTLLDDIIEKERKILIKI